MSDSTDLDSLFQGGNHHVLATHNGESTTVWVEYDGSKIATLDTHGGRSTLSSPAANGRNLGVIPAGWAALLWTNNAPSQDERGLYCWGCNTHFDTYANGMDHYGDTECSAFGTDSIETVQVEGGDDDAA